MGLEGKGYYIWKIHNCEGGDINAITRRAIDAGLSHVLIKIADGPRAYNVDLAAPLVDALKGAGIAVWGWQFVYGDEPFGEADIAYHRIQTLQLDGFVVDGEDAYKGKHQAANAYMDSLRTRLGNYPIALSSYRYPNYHTTFPWVEFLSRATYNMPQVYWVQAHNPVEQLERSIAQFQNIYPVVPIIPTGSAYGEYGWKPDPREILDFLARAREIGLPAANFWSWDYSGSDAGRGFWNVIADFGWTTSAPPRDIIDHLIAALNRGDAQALTQMYHPSAVLVTTKNVYIGAAGIRRYYEELLTNELPDADFTVETRVREGNIRYIRWDSSTASNGKAVQDGYDTIAMRLGLIQYHSRVYRVS